MTQLRELEEEHYRHVILGLEYDPKIGLKAAIEQLVDKAVASTTRLAEVKTLLQ